MNIEAENDLSFFVLSGAPWLCPSRSISHVGTDFSIDSLGLSRRLGVPSRPSALLFSSSPFPLSSVILLAHPSPSPSPSLKVAADGEVTINFQIEDDLERASRWVHASARAREAIVIAAASLKFIRKTASATKA